MNRSGYKCYHGKAHPIVSYVYNEKRATSHLETLISVIDSMIFALSLREKSVCYIILQNYPCYTLLINIFFFSNSTLHCIRTLIHRTAEILFEQIDY